MYLGWFFSAVDIILSFLLVTVFLHMAKMEDRTEVVYDGLMFTGGILPGLIKPVH